jgi:hypothetical protein
VAVLLCSAQFCVPTDYDDLWQYLPKENLFTNNDDDDNDFQDNNLTKDINDLIFSSSSSPSFKYLGSSTKTRTTTTTTKIIFDKEITQLVPISRRDWKKAANHLPASDFLK